MYVIFCRNRHRATITFDVYFYRVIRPRFLNWEIKSRLNRTSDYLLYLRQLKSIMVYSHSCAYMQTHQFKHSRGENKSTTTLLHDGIPITPISIFLIILGNVASIRRYRIPIPHLRQCNFYNTNRKHGRFNKKSN
jgi:hypothetical protein